VPQKEDLLAPQERDETVQYTGSADGTTIAYERFGEGPALVLVFGALCDRKGINSPGERLSADFTVYTYDRRGRGASGDSSRYRVEREIEDLAALIAAAGGSAHVFGHSSGAVLALKAAAAGLPITRLVAYEPPFVLEGARERPRADLADRVRQLVLEDRRTEALRLDLTEAMQFPDEVLAGIEASPLWPGFLALAHTLSYDLAVCGPGNHVPVEEIVAVGVPTLVIDGGKSPDWMRAAARRVASLVPGAQHVTLEGQHHGAAPEVLAPVLRDFYLARSS